MAATVEKRHFLRLLLAAAVAVHRLLAALLAARWAAATAALVRHLQSLAVPLPMLAAVAVAHFLAQHIKRAAQEVLAAAATAAPEMARERALLARPIPAVAAVEAGLFPHRSLMAQMAALASSSSNTLSPSNLS